SGSSVVKISRGMGAPGALAESGRQALPQAAPRRSVGPLTRSVARLRVSLPRRCRPPPTRSLLRQERRVRGRLALGGFSRRNSELKVRQVSGGRLADWYFSSFQIWKGRREKMIDEFVFVPQTAWKTCPTGQKIRAVGKEFLRFVGVWRAATRG